MKIASLFLLLKAAAAFVEPVSIKGRHFYKEDQPPGGSSGVGPDKDPLSDPEVCARDIVLFQDLGVNTIRVYSVNPDLNHDKCMTLLAVAGIYLVLDVNSPLEHQHLNRYEPWVTYNDLYLEHVFKVLEEFSPYNNTLAFFAGNEVINDRVSAKASPIFIKALIRDMKDYSAKHISRQVPIGYSAADDLSFRVSLPDYLQCQTLGLDASIDFYGVNSYQWCGSQTMESSGYSSLVHDYESFTKPIFFSEYGCNEVLPRKFEEVQALYSKDMTGVFSGGLIYEFNQEPNNYGLVDETLDGRLTLLPDFHSLKAAFAKVNIEYDQAQVAKELSKKKGLFSKGSSTSTNCEASYANIAVDDNLPETREIKSLISTGVSSKRGKYTELTSDDLRNSLEVLDQGHLYVAKENIEIEIYPRKKKSVSVENKVIISRSAVMIWAVSSILIVLEYLISLY